MKRKTTNPEQLGRLMQLHRDLDLGMPPATFRLILSIFIEKANALAIVDSVREKRVSSPSPLPTPSSRSLDQIVSNIASTRIAQDGSNDEEAGVDRPRRSVQFVMPECDPYIKASLG
jgi:hypothetical protein